MANNNFKPVDSVISSRQETSTFQTVNGTGLTYTLCDRTDLTDLETNYFKSFNLPYDVSAFSSGSTLSKRKPELLQLNVDKIVICPIPPSYYEEIIDGRTVTFKVPQNDGGSSYSSKTLISSTYSVLAKKNTSTALLGENIAFLFCDDINLPYTGTTRGVSRASNRTWNTSSFLTRPVAVSYSDLVATDINTDQRPWVTVNQAITTPSNYPTTTDQGYNYDIPVGFIALDKGFVVITHPDIVNEIPWGLGQIPSTGAINVSSGTTDIYFSSTTKSVATFNDISIDYRTTAVCIALPQEFYFSNNPTYDFTYNYTEQINGTNNFDSVYITEVGLYNKNRELIAIAKLDRPVEKTFSNVVTFTLDIRI